MANGINNADKLLARILDDARGEAAKIEAQACAQAEEIRARAEQEAAALAAETEARAKAAHAEAIEHAETAAQLEARKQALAARRAVLDEAFEAAPKNEPITIKTLAEIAGVSQDTMRRYLKEFEDEYMVYRGTVQARPLLSGTSQVP